MLVLAHLKFLAPTFGGIISDREVNIWTGLDQSRQIPFPQKYNARDRDNSIICRESFVSLRNHWTSVATEA